MSHVIRNSRHEFEALRDATAARLELSPAMVEKDYWVTEILRVAPGLLGPGEQLIFKGGTSLSKAFGLIERFSEDIDVIIVTERTGNSLRQLFRRCVTGISEILGLDGHRENEGRGHLSARFHYPHMHHDAALSSGVLLELGSRGGWEPNHRRTIRSMMAEIADSAFGTSSNDFEDLASIDIGVLAPERTLVEKLAFLHHRATVRDYRALARGSRHLYDVWCLLRSDRVVRTLDERTIALLAEDVDQRSAKAGWPYAPRPIGGFGSSPAFGFDPLIRSAFEEGFENLSDLVWGEIPSVGDALEQVREKATLL